MLTSETKLLINLKTRDPMLREDQRDYVKTDTTTKKILKKEVKITPT